MAPDLKEMRDRLKFCTDEWKQNFDQGDIDLLYANGDPFTPADKRAWRDITGRDPYVCDELGQHLNRIRNHVLTRPRGINVTPTNTQASAITAADRTDIIRGIEYQGNAQAARLSAYQSMVETGIGVYGLAKSYRAGSRHMDIEYRIFPDRKQVVVDPLITQPTGSDMKYGFVRSPRPKKDFQREYGKDARSDAGGLTGQDMVESAMWFQMQGGVDIVVETEYWKIEEKKETLFYIDGPNGQEWDIPESVMEKNGMLWGEGETLWMPLPGGGYRPVGKYTGEREETVPEVYQCITNGYEDLKTTPWDTKQIPLILMLGKTSFVTRGGQTRREVLSLIRLARDPFLMLCYTRSKQLMLAALAPIAPWIAATGQVTGDNAIKWDNAHRIAYGRMEYEAIIDGLKDADGNPIILPPPQRNGYEPPIQAMEVLCEALIRAIRSAMGMSLLPAAMQRENQKSGVALQEIQEVVDQGASHFLDTYDKAIAQEGKVVNDQIDFLLSKPRDVPAVTATRKNHVLTIGKPAIDPRTKEQRTINLGSSSDHAVTVAAGPAAESNRQEVGEFAMNLLQKGVLEMAIQQTPGLANVMAGEAMRMMEKGPAMDSLADKVDPQEKDSAEAKLGQVIQVAQQQKIMLSESKQIIDGQHQEIQRLRSGVDKQHIANEGNIEGKRVDQQTAVMKEMFATLREDIKAGREVDMRIFETKLGEVTAELAHDRSQEAMATAAALEPEPVEAGA